ncbi:MAG: OB-fold nucleic acid binding domain-containing protein, partial [Bacteroidota bacterium]|nr:OB-fold nucleic acid binding domain-containing protein [Bacteroidota bacterium]
MQKYLIKDLAKHEGQDVTLMGWASNKRESKGLVFIVLRDGTGWCQCVVSLETVGENLFEEARKVSLESSLTISGKIVKDERQMGGFELQATSVTLIGESIEYPIANKEHGVDFLMDKRHLWLRTQRQWAIMRIRNQIIFAIHKFFQEEGFVQMHAPLITGNACEGTS